MRPILALCTLVLLASSAAGQTSQPLDRPNILVVMVDQLVPQLTGPYGDERAKTPHMDRLAREGVVFTAAYTNSPLCTPARAALMSGQYVSRTGTYDNGAILSSEVPTVAHHLRLAGYETVLSGKMHFVGADQLHGFERRLTADIYPADFSWTPEWNDQAVVNPLGKPKAQVALDVRIEKMPKQMVYDDNSQEQAIGFLRSRTTAVEPPRPFFLVASFSHPHPPFSATRELWELYEGVEMSIPKMPSDMTPHRSAMDRWLNTFHGTDLVDLGDQEAMLRLRRTYYGMITYVDRKLGELMQCLDEEGVLDNTVVLFTSDHGDMLGERGMVQKRTFYEWSARVPLIAWAPSRFASGQRIEAPVSLIDIFPTLAELSGAPAPIEIDGRSFLDLLEQRPGPGEPRIAISEYHGEGVLAPCFMIRQGDYKYVHIEGEAPQLFNLRDDPREWHNLAGTTEHRTVQQRLHKLLLREFVPQQIDSAVRLSQQRRLLMREAMKAGTRTHWDYLPEEPSELP